MIEVIIDNEVKKIDPRLTISRYQKIQINPERYNDPTEVLALYLNVSVDELKDLPLEQIRMVESVLTENTLSSTKTDVVFTFELDGISYGLENEWENMTWGQWTDLEVFSQKDKINDNIHILMALLYRPIVSQDGIKYKLEKFNSTTVMDRAQKFLNIPIQYWFGCATFFFSNVYRIHKRYSNFFESEDNDREGTETSEEDTPKMAPSESAARFYFEVSFELVNGDITKYERLTETNMYLCLTAASLIKDRVIKQENELKKLKKN